MAKLISWDIWKILTEETSFSHKKWLTQQLETLDTIGETGKPTAIRDLILLTEHKRKAIRTKAIETIEILLTEITQSKIR